jgi:hypothetical protein
VAGLLADRLGLADALRLVPAASLAAIAILAIGRRAAPAVGREEARLGVKNDALTRIGRQK